MSASTPTRRRRYRVTGQVQGVGFRPFVYRLAGRFGLTGRVGNDARGVFIEAQGTDESLDAFAGALLAEAPPLASIEQIGSTEIGPVEAEADFEIGPSAGGEMDDAQVTVDTAMCAECRRELLDCDDRRYRYPFINCTNCGPRYSIVRSIPYDRPNTTMAGFEMCPRCAREYGDPGDRRFHAQPIACEVCGPRVTLLDHNGEEVPTPAIPAAAMRLLAGEIVGLKGLGGYHLACRADSEAVVGRLRTRKHRDAKPFALMVRDLAAVERLCETPPEAAALLSGPRAPIVLLPMRPAARTRLAMDVYDGLDALGVMLPYTPLHALLFESLPPELPLVMTSGNMHAAPLIHEDAAAADQLIGIADALLVHDRPIARPIDDSVVQAIDRSSGPWAFQVLRRARGYAPRPVNLEALGLDTDAPPVLAVGGELKNAVCLLRGNRAVLSPHIGNLKDGRVYRHFTDTIDTLERLLDCRPRALAADLHPQYLSTSYAQRREALRDDAGSADGAPSLLRVQHHHAHVVSCMAENGCADPVIGLACDGVGYGDDGTAWGCEVLYANLHAYERMGHLRPLPLIGGDKAAVETWRPALAALVDTFGPDCAGMPVLYRLAAEPETLGGAVEMLREGLNCPPSSSLGRWFDAVAALCGVAEVNEYEGQAAMKLEACAEGGESRTYRFRLTETAPFRIDLRPMVEGIVGDLGGDQRPGLIAARFHNTVVAMLLDAVVRAREACGLETVALSGGCFANRLVTRQLSGALEAEGFRVLRHHRTPCNDGGIALGQAVVAAEKLRRGAPAAAAEGVSD